MGLLFRETQGRIQNLYPRDREIYSFGRGPPAIQHYLFSFSYTCASYIEDFFLIGQL